jgi:hypothetical protein
MFLSLNLFIYYISFFEECQAFFSKFLNSFKIWINTRGSNPNPSLQSPIQGVAVLYRANHFHRLCA